MSRKPTLMYLESTIGLLVEHFGIGPVRSALARVSSDAAEAPESHPRQRPNKSDQKAIPSITISLIDLGRTDPEKCSMLTDFYRRLKDKAVLPESQDIRQFAQIIGLKDIAGKSRGGMISNLIRALLERSNERLHGDIEAAANISEQQRKQGFSLLTDKMLSGTG